MEGFYGLTGVSLALSPVPLRSYSKVVKSLDNSSNRKSLTILKKELEMVIKFLEGLSASYEDRESNIAKAMLSARRDSLTEEQISNYEKQLEGKQLIISRQQKCDNGYLDLSDGAYAIVTELHNKIDTIKFFYDKLHYQVESTSSGVSAFGEALYILRMQNRPTLNRKLKRFSSDSRILSETLLGKLESEVMILEPYLSESKVEMTDYQNLDILEEMEKSVRAMNAEYFNSLLMLELTEEDYYNISLELDKFGLCGFNIYNSEFFDEFLKTASLSNMSDLYIYPSSDLYNFVLDIREVVDSIKAVEGY